MKYKLPKIDLSEPDRIWMEQLYNCIKKGEKPTYRKLRSDLNGKIPNDFNPSEIDDRLVQWGRHLTLLGIWHLDPESDMFEKTDLVMRKIREMLLRDPKLERIETGMISEEMDISQNEVSSTLYYISNFGGFMDSTSGSDYGIDSITINRDRVFDKYLNYEGIEKLVDSFIREQALEKGYNGAVGTTSIEDSGIEKKNPYFHSSIRQIDHKLSFVLMPFSLDWSERVYNKLIKRILENMGLQCLRADSLKGQIVMEDIWIKINSCAFIIADITSTNSNVMYELGLVHSIGKPSILITQNLKEIPFDFTHHRHYEYQDNVDGFKDLENKLPDVIKVLYQEFYPEISL